MDFDPEVIYYDLCLRNFQSSVDKHLRFSETRDSPLVRVANDYLLSVVRFQIDSFSLPVWFCDIQKNQGDVDLTPYSIILQCTDTFGNVYTPDPTYIKWVCPVVGTPAPLPPNQRPNGFQDFSSDYYKSHNYEYLIKLVNQCFDDAFVELVKLIDSISSVDVPFMKWNSERNCAELYVRLSHYAPNSSPGIKIFINEPLAALFNSFPFMKYLNNSQSMRFQVLTDPFGGSDVVELYSNPNPFIKVTQNYSTLSQASPISSIVFTTSTMPVVANQLSAPIILDNGQVINLTPTTSDIYQNIITDFIADESLYRDGGALLYIPSGNYRYISLVGQQEIKQIDINVYYRDKLGNLNVYLLPAGASASMKLMFIKKSLISK